MAPTRSMAARTAGLLWLLRLSIMTIIARRERWQQTLFDIGQETGPVHRAIEDTRSRKAVVAERRHEGQRVPVPVGPGRAATAGPEGSGP